MSELTTPKKYKLTPWGKKVAIAMIQRDLNAATLADMLRARGFRTSRTMVIGMMRGYRGKRSDREFAAINEILAIEQ